MRRVPGRIDDLIAQVDAWISSYERMLVRFKDELAARLGHRSKGTSNKPRETPSTPKLGARETAF